MVKRKKRKNTEKITITRKTESAKGRKKKRIVVVVVESQLPIENEGGQRKRETWEGWRGGGPLMNYHWELQEAQDKKKRTRRRKFKLSSCPKWFLVCALIFSFFLLPLEISFSFLTLFPVTDLKSAKKPGHKREKKMFPCLLGYTLLTFECPVQLADQARALFLRLFKEFIEKEDIR